MILHFNAGTFNSVTILKVLHNAYLITEETNFLNTTANLVNVRDIRPISVKVSMK